MRHIVKYAAGAVLFLGVWTAVLAGLAFTAEPGAIVAVFAAPGAAARVAVDAGGSLEEIYGAIAITRSDEPGFVRRLYGAGALLVIDARVVAGCRAVFANLQY